MITKEQLEKRRMELANTRARMEAELNALTGMIEEVVYWLNELAKTEEQAGDNSGELIPPPA